MKQPVVSIIIPVYKTEEFLPECMDSVLNQDYPKLEILLVDDGSPDYCPQLCDQYAKKYEHVKVIHQTNQGSGISRNTGMAACSGEYVMFLDSDDCLDGKETVRKLVTCAQEKGADIVVGSFRRFFGKTVSEVNHHHLREGAYTKTPDFRFKGFYMYGHLAYDWGKLYRKSFLEKHDLKNRSYPFTQDKAHNMACIAYQPLYAFIDDSVYLYRVNEKSVTFRYKENLMPVWISIATDFHDFLKERNIKNQYGDLTAFHIFFGSFFLVKQELLCKKHGILEAAKALKKYGEDSFVKKTMNDLARGRYLKEIDAPSWKIVIFGASLLFSLRLYLPFAAAVAMLRKVKLDEKITKSRYKKN